MNDLPGLQLMRENLPVRLIVVDNKRLDAFDRRFGGQLHHGTDHLLFQMRREPEGRASAGTLSRIAAHHFREFLRNGQAKLRHHATRCWNHRPE